MRPNQARSTYHPHPSSLPSAPQIEPRSPNQRAYLTAMGQYDLVLASGPAGTGKTWLAVAAGAQALMSGAVSRIIMSRPVLEAGERLGFLPGDMREKTDPYLRPLYEALADILSPEETERYLRSGLIEIAPLAFMRGRSLRHAFVILDEAQNCTRAQMKMFLTRLGEGSVFVACGDCHQSDLPAGESSGLAQALTLLAGFEEVGIIHFDESDIQRHPLIGRIVQAYDQQQKKHASP